MTLGQRGGSAGGHRDDAQARRSAAGGQVVSRATRSGSARPGGIGGAAPAARAPAAASELARSARRRSSTGRPTPRRPAWSRSRPRRRPAPRRSPCAPCRVCAENMTTGVGRRAHDLAHRLGAVHARHVEVHRDDVGLELRRRASTASLPSLAWPITSKRPSSTGACAIAARMNSESSTTRTRSLRRSWSGSISLVRSVRGAMRQHLVAR